MRHKQQPIAPFGYKHGTHGYKVRGCRCEVCRAAMSAYGKSRYVPAERIAVPVVETWWLSAKPEAFTKRCEDQLPKMREGQSGKGRHRPISTDEISR